MLFSVLDKMEKGQHALEDQELPVLAPYADAAYRQMGRELQFFVRMGEHVPKAWQEPVTTAMTYRTFLQTGKGRLNSLLMKVLEEALLKDEIAQEEGGLTDLMGQYMSRALLESDNASFRRLTAMCARLSLRHADISLHKLMTWNNDALRKIALARNNVAAMRHIMTCVPEPGCPDRKAAIRDWLLAGYRGAYMVVDSYHLGFEDMQEFIIRRARDVGAEEAVLKFAGPHTICHAIQSGDPQKVRKCWDRLRRFSTAAEMKEHVLLEGGALLWSGLKTEKSTAGAASFLTLVAEELGRDVLRELLDQEWLFTRDVHTETVPLLVRYLQEYFGDDALEARLRKDNYEAILNAAQSENTDFLRDLLSFARELRVDRDGRAVPLLDGVFADNDEHLLKEIMVAGSLNNLTHTLLYLSAMGEKDVMEKAFTSPVMVKALERTDFLERLAIIMSAAEQLKLPGVAIPETVKTMMFDEPLPRHELWQVLGGEAARWEKVANREAPAGVPACYPPYNFKPHLYDQILPYVEKILTLEGEKAERAPLTAYKLSVLFANKDEVERFLTKTVEKHRPYDQSWPVSHITSFEIPLRGMWTVPHWRGLVQRYGFAAARFIGLAPEIEAHCHEKNIGLPRTPQEIRDIARIVVYDPEEKNLEYAGLAMDFNIAAGLYKKGVEILENELKRESYLPDIAIDGADIGKDNYYMEKLPDHDPRGLLLGEITNCCQSLGNNGEYAARAGMTDAESGFYVWKHKTKGKITPNDRIVAQSWAWLSPDRQAVVFDSFERLSSAYNHLASPFIEQFAHDVQAAGQARAVYVGTEGETPKDNSWQPKTARPFALYREGIVEKSDSETVYPVEPRNHRAAPAPAPA